MRLLLQRVSRANLTVNHDPAGEIGTGLLVLAGFGLADQNDLPGSPLWEKLCSKVTDLRIFPDHQERMNLSLADTGGDLMLVSQFTLYADCKKGRRPSFGLACPPETATPLFKRLVRDLRTRTPGLFVSGTFGADMSIDFANWGPVTILLDSDDL